MRPLAAARLAPVRVAALVAALGAGSLAGCAADGPGAGDGPRADGGRPTECRAGDRQVAGEDGCLLDDAACYELVSGAYCTGPRGGTCPAGSSALAPDRPCPPGARCIRVGESLECVIG